MTITVPDSLLAPLLPKQQKVTMGIRPIRSPSDSMPNRTVPAETQKPFKEGCSCRDRRCDAVGFALF
uniref:Uncharacterized protein n=1 Tax=Panagrellus redivivus TaxID=6233 RepID=A0A7E4VAF9_PANRE